MIAYDFSIIRSSLIKMLKINMGLKDGEKVLFLSDILKPEEWYHPYDRVADLAMRSLMIKQAYEIAKKEFLKNQIDYFVYESTGRNAIEPPEEVSAKMINYDVIIMFNTYSLSHTNARENATKQGARIASCANIDLDMLLPNDVIDMDYIYINEKTHKIATLLTYAENVRLMTPDGTDIAFSIKERDALVDNGFYKEKGKWGNLPGGEAYIAPLERTANGLVFVPAGWAYNLQENMVFQFANGDAVNIIGGGVVGEYYRDSILSKSSPRHRRNFAELGIGTNYKAKKRGCILEAKKIDGVIHVAIGDNCHIGGNVESDFHDDFVLPNPTLYLDGKIVIKDGKLLDE